MGKSSVFIKIDNYREVLDLIDELKQQLEGVQGTLDELTALREKEDQELIMWKKHLHAVHDNLATVDKTLFEVDNE